MTVLRRIVPLPLLLALFAGCNSPGAPYHGTALELARSPLPKDQNFKTQEIHRTAWQSIHLVQLLGSLAEHHHVGHEETVVVLKGTGKMRLGDRVVPIGPGAVVHIPAGTRHGVEMDAGQEAVAISIFVPPFDGKDRHFSARDERHGDHRSRTQFEKERDPLRTTFD